MTFNLDAFARDMSAAARIPSSLIPSVVHRAHVAKRAVEMVTGYTPLGDGVRVLVRRVVARAAEDHRRGVLERRCA